jgi:histidine triad (HIT) family protein
MDDCIFCKIVKGEIPSDNVYEDDNFIVIKEIKPVVDNHCLIISKKHFKNLLDAPTTIYSEFLDAAKKLALKFIDEKNAEGFNLHMNNFEVAGQLVPHLHMHFLPRKKEDGFHPCA